MELEYDGETTDQDYEFDQHADCTWCGGEGFFFGDETPGFDYINDDPEGVYDCPACLGTGLREKQSLF